MPTHSAAFAPMGTLNIDIRTASRIARDLLSTARDPFGEGKPLKAFLRWTRHNGC